MLCVICPHLCMYYYRILWFSLQVNNKMVCSPCKLHLLAQRCWAGFSVLGHLDFYLESQGLLPLPPSQRRVWKFLGAQQEWAAASRHCTAPHNGEFNARHPTITYLEKKRTKIGEIFKTHLEIWKKMPHRDRRRWGPLCHWSRLCGQKGSLPS